MSTPPLRLTLEQEVAERLTSKLMHMFAKWREYEAAGIEPSEYRREHVRDAIKDELRAYEYHLRQEMAAP